MKRYPEYNNSKAEILKAVLIIIIVWKLYNYYKLYIMILLAIKKNRINNTSKDCIIKKGKNNSKENNYEVEKNSLNKVNTEIKKEDKLASKSVTAHIPLIVTEKRISIPIEKEINFNENVTEILNTKSDIHINDTKFIPLRILDNNPSKIEGELLLEGKLISTIHYSSLEEMKNNECKGYTKTLKTLFPIKLRTLIDCYRPPGFNYKNRNKNKINVCCSIKEVNISTKDIILKNRPMKENNYLNIFNKTKRKIIVNLLLTITQIYPAIIHNNYLLEKPSAC